MARLFYILVPDIEKDFQNTINIFVSTYQHVLIKKFGIGIEIGIRIVYFIFTKSSKKKDLHIMDDTSSGS